MNIRLSDYHFAILIRGGEIQVKGVRMILADIGFDRMHDMLREAERETEDTKGSSER